MLTRKVAGITGRMRMYSQLVKAVARLKRIETGRTIALITHELTSSGSSLLLMNLCDYYCKKGYKVVILTENTQPAAKEIQESLQKAYAVLRLNYRRSTRMRALHALYKAGVRCAIGNTVLAGTFAQELNAVGIRSTFLIHEMWASLNILDAREIARQIIQYGDKVLFPSQIVRDSFFEYAGMDCDEKKISILPQGCRAEFKPGLSRAEARTALRSRFSLETNARILVGAGAINFGKGMDMCLPVLKKLAMKEDGAPFYMLWAGAINQKDPYFLWLQVQIRALQLEDRIHFLGFISDAARYAEVLMGGDVFYLSSREDSFPSVLIEAACAQIPALAYEGSGGGADYITQHRTGLCVPMGDVDAACHAILEMCETPELYANEATKTRAEKKFAFSEYAEHILKLTKV